MNLGPSPTRRRIGLTPMIDVVFLMLVFFMLIARFGQEGVIAIPLAGEGTADYEGAPRLIDVAPDALRLNGVEVPLAELPLALAPLVANPDDLIVLRPRDGASVQRIVDVLSALSAAGLTGGTFLP